MWATGRVWPSVVRFIILQCLQIEKQHACLKCSVLQCKIRMPAPDSAFCSTGTRQVCLLPIQPVWAQDKCVFLLGKSAYSPDPQNQSTLQSQTLRASSMPKNWSSELSRKSECRSNPWLQSKFARVLVMLVTESLSCLQQACALYLHNLGYLKELMWSVKACQIFHFENVSRIKCKQTWVNDWNIFFLTERDPSQNFVLD